MGMERPQVVVVGEKVCVGGGDTENDDDGCVVFQYNQAGNVWNSLPPCPVFGFGLGQLSGELLTVGGAIPDDTETVTDKVYHYKQESQEFMGGVSPAHANC